ncbi:DUF2927 domain-containing protein [Pseudoroseicyclus tamaricis]|uniref:DUF2927 domain-containing protein n=1 Tax=Pseudoroseicyclus tamaricis TaxID=2705421 RepID=A0A6B2JU35_9RHOB|nr:DUF2927 domain-containing protein [Pseudoroseicyclus tamaricis]NDV01570.1 DUF2927 domain-containing protein [Pseudoroseicyclus tamaricis]
MIRPLLTSLAILLASCAPVPDAGPGSSGVAGSGGEVSRNMPISSSLPPMRTFPVRAAAPPTRSNAQMAEDFLDLAFKLESGRNLPILTRYEGPITLRLAGDVPPTMATDLSGLLARLRNEAGIPISLTSDANASIIVEAVPRADLSAAVPRAACFVVPRIQGWQDFLANRRSAALDWATLNVRQQASIFIPADAAPQEIRNCLHEELAQALGPLNDLFRLTDSTFNDDDIHAVLTGFDMLMLRAFYAPELRSGMSRAEVAARLPALLARLNPAGQRVPVAATPAIPRDWQRLVETSLASAASPGERRRSAAAAVNQARALGLGPAQQGFAWYALGRLELGRDRGRALTAFQNAALLFAAAPDTRLHEAHVSLQLAAFALSDGDAEEVLALTGPAIEVATRAENAALLATLMLFRAEALRLLGRDAQADALVVDSLGWARYGYGADGIVRARQREIEGLRPDVSG